MRLLRRIRSTEHLIAFFCGTEKPCGGERRGLVGKEKKISDAPDAPRVL